MLIIPSATLEDQGIYTCTVTRSSSARDEKSVDLKLGGGLQVLDTVMDVFGYAIQYVAITLNGPRKMVYFV